MALTLALFYHPLWALAEPNIESPEQLDEILAPLPPQFRRTSLVSREERLFVSRGSEPLLDDIAEMGGVDGLAACLGYIHRSRLLDDVTGSITYTIPTVEAFNRCFAFGPFRYFRDDFQIYLFDTFLNDAAGSMLRSEEVERKMLAHSEQLRYCRDIVQALNILRVQDRPETALYLVERVVPSEILRKYAQTSRKTRDDYFRQLPIAVELLKVLKAWQREGQRYIPLPHPRSNK